MFYSLFFSFSHCFDGRPTARWLERSEFLPSLVVTGDERFLVFREIVEPNGIFSFSTEDFWNGTQNMWSHCFVPCCKLVQSTVYTPRATEYDSKQMWPDVLDFPFYGTFVVRAILYRLRKLFTHVRVYTEKMAKITTKKKYFWFFFFVCYVRPFIKIYLSASVTTVFYHCPSIRAVFGRISVTRNASLFTRTIFPAQTRDIPAVVLFLFGNTVSFSPYTATPVSSPLISYSLYVRLKRSVLLVPRLRSPSTTPPFVGRGPYISLSKTLGLLLVYSLFLEIQHYDFCILASRTFGFLKITNIEILSAL